MVKLAMTVAMESCGQISVSLDETCPIASRESLEEMSPRATILVVLFSSYRTDTTRVEFTIPLRENWALPFFAIQIAAITYFLRPNLQPLSEVSF